MTVEDSIINKLSKKYNTPREVVRSVVESQFEFIRQEIKKVDLSNAFSDILTGVVYIVIMIIIFLMLLLLIMLI